MSEEWVIPDGGNIVLALTDDDLGVEGQVEIDHREQDIDDGGIPESDSAGAIAAIHNERRISITGRVEAERIAAKDLADAVEKSKKDRRDVYNSLFEDDTTSTGMGTASLTVRLCTTEISDVARVPGGGDGKSSLSHIFSSSMLLYPSWAAICHKTWRWPINPPSVPRPFLAEVGGISPAIFLKCIAA